MKKRILFLAGLLVTSSASSVFAESSSSVRTNVKVNTSTGNNTINGQVQSSSTCKTYIEQNGKVIVDSDDCAPKDIVEESEDGGRVEVHMNSNQTPTAPTTPPKPTNSVVVPTVRPTVDIEPTIEKQKEAIKKGVLAAREAAEEQRKSILEQVGESLSEMFERIGSLLRIF